MPLTYEPIASLTGTGTFTSIPQTYTDLRLVGRTDPGGQNIEWRYNSNDSAIYGNTFIEGNAVGTNSFRLNNQTQAYGAYNFSSGIGFYEIDILEYTSTSKWKTALCRFSNDVNGAGIVSRNVSLWRSTAAVTSLEIRNNGGVPLTLYGVKNA
jgi:hypothetical protein